VRRFLIDETNDHKRNIVDWIIKKLRFMKKYYDGFSNFSKGNTLFENDVPKEKEAYIDELMNKVNDLIYNFGPIDGWKLDNFSVRRGWFIYINEDRVTINLFPFFNYDNKLTPILHFDGQIYELQQFTITNLSKRLTMDLSRDAIIIRDIVVDLFKRLTAPEIYIEAMKKLTDTTSDKQLIKYALEKKIKSIIKMFIVLGKYVPDNLNDVAMIIHVLDDKDHGIIVKHMFPLFMKAQKAKTLFGI
jgi:hypothetical protein